MSREDSEIGIEIYEDRPRSGRSAEVISEELKKRFFAIPVRKTLSCNSTDR